MLQEEKDCFLLYHQHGQPYLTCNIYKNEIYTCISIDGIGANWVANIAESGVMDFSTKYTGV